MQEDFSKKDYMSQKKFQNELFTIHKSKATIKLNKPTYIGMYLLKLNKVLIYDFHYDRIKNEYGNSSRQLYSDYFSQTKSELRRVCMSQRGLSRPPSAMA